MTIPGSDAIGYTAILLSILNERLREEGIEVERKEGA